MQYHHKFYCLPGSKLKSVCETTEELTLKGFNESVEI